MATSAQSAPSSPVPSPAHLGTGAGSASTRFGGEPTGSFAAVLDQLGAPPPTQTAATAVTDGTGAAATAIPDQLSPDASLVHPTIPPPPPPPPALSMQPAPSPKQLDTQAPDASAGAVASVAKKIKNTPSPDTTSEAVAPVPNPVLPTLPIAIPPKNAVPAAVAQAGTTVSAPASAADNAVQPSTSAAGSSSTAASSSPSSSLLAGVPISSQLARQAAVGNKAGLSVGDNSDEGDTAPLTKAGPQRSTATSSQADQNLPTIPLLSTSPALQSAAIPPMAAALAVPSRSSAPALSRTSGPNASSPLASSLIDNQLQPLPSAPADSQAGALTPSPLNALIAAPPVTAESRSTQATATPQSPAAQVAQTIAEPVKIVLTSPVQAGSTAPHVITIQITPEQMGKVEVRIERTNDGPAKIQLTAERPETLSRLVHDQSQLQEALNNAGIPQHSRTIEFSLASPATDGSAFSSSSFGSNTASGNSAGNGSQRQSSAYYNPDLNNSNEGSAVPTQSLIVRPGIDITA